MEEGGLRSVFLASLISFSNSHSKAKEQANAKIERVSTKKLNDVISSQKQFSDKSGLGYTGGSSSSGSVTKEVKFIKAKEQIEVSPTAEKPKMEEMRNVDDQRMLNNSHKQSVGRFESRAKSRPRSQRSPRSNYVCHHCGLQGHTRPNCQNLRAMNNASALRSRGPRNDRRNWAGEPSNGRNGDPGMMDVMKMISAFTNCLESFTRRFESPNSHTQSYKDITPNASDV